VWSVTKLGQFFSSTLTNEFYLHALQEEFHQFLQGMGFSFGGTFFLTGYSSAKSILDFLIGNFNNSVLSNHFPDGLVYWWTWPPYS
jgi:hypothetical protein